MTRFLELESEIFDRRCGVLEKPTEFEPDGWDFVHCRIPAVDIAGAATLQGMGFHFVGALVGLTIDMVELRAKLDIRRLVGLPNVFPAGKGDMCDLMEVANDLEHSRFHNDPVLTDRAAKFYMHWISNAVEGHVNGGVLVAQDDNLKTQGFVIYDSDRLVLICVRGSDRRKGVGWKLAALGLGLTTAPIARLGTESTSLAALNLYLSLGAKFEKTWLSFHWHRKRKLGVA